MLVLTRRVGEEIRIGEDIVIAIVEIKGGHVRVGIKAPQSVSIHRGEIYEKVVKENQLAASASLDVFSKMKEAIKGK